MRFSEADATSTEHGDPPTDPAIAADSGPAKMEQPTLKRNGVVDAGVQTELSGTMIKEQVS